MQDELELFKCFLCGKYFPYEVAKRVKVKYLVLPKDLCPGCYEEQRKQVPPKIEEKKE